MDIPPDRTPSVTASGLRTAVLKIDFGLRQDIIHTPTFDGFLYERVTDNSGSIWKVPVTNGYATDEVGTAAITTFGVDACLVGIIDSEDGGRRFRTVLHSNPFLEIPVQTAPALDLMESPFAVFVEHLPQTIHVKRNQLVFRKRTHTDAVRQAENYLRHQFPDVNVVLSETPFDEIFDIQAVIGEVDVFRAGKREGLRI